ncbi:response regulator [Magnetococcales bacterium HHB-1]
MKILIADDEYPNRLLLKNLLSPYGDCDLVINGEEAVDVCEMAMAEMDYYHLICLDIMMPGMDGQTALLKIRDLERENGFSGKGEAVIFMTTALDDEDQVVQAYFKGNCTDYLVKPITREKLVGKLKEYQLTDFVDSPSKQV